MSYKCLVVDDEELARRLLSNHISQLPDYELVGSCASAIEASKFLKNQQVDLLFLDIEMPVLKGVDFFKNLVVKPKVIFTTAYREYAVEGFELNAVDYLLKPITFARFFRAVEKFESQLESHSTEKEVSQFTKDEYIFIRKDRKQVKLNFSDILYVQSLKDYITIYTADEKHNIKHSLSGFLELLDTRFLRTHRSYIVNLRKITAYTTYDVEIGRMQIPIGDNYKKEVASRLK